MAHTHKHTHTHTHTHTHAYSKHINVKKEEKQQTVHISIKWLRIMQHGTKNGETQFKPHICDTAVYIE